MGTESYGQYYWCVKVTPDVSPDGKIYVMADDVIVVASGTINFIRRRDDDTITINLGIASGKWFAYFAVSLMDGSAVAVEYWKDEVVRNNQSNPSLSR